MCEAVGKIQEGEVLEVNVDKPLFFELYVSIYNYRSTG